MNASLGCIVYANDILLLSSSFSKLHEILNIYHAFGVEWHISFNPNKSPLCAFEVILFQKLLCAWVL